MKHKKSSRSERKILNQIIYRNDGYRKDAEQFNLVDDKSAGKEKPASKSRKSDRFSFFY